MQLGEGVNDRGAFAVGSRKWPREAEVATRGGKGGDALRFCFRSFDQGSNIHLSPLMRDALKRSFAVE